MSAGVHTFYAVTCAPSAFIAVALLSLTAMPKPTLGQSAPALAPAAAGVVLPDQAANDATFETRSRALEDTLLARTLEKAVRWWARHEADTTRPANVMSTPEDRIDPIEAALLIRSGRDVRTGNAVLQEEAAHPFRGGMFYIHDIMAAYLHAGDSLHADAKAAIRRSLRERPIYRGDTENHWLLYYTGLYLAAQTWPGEAGTTWFNGRSSDENLTEAHEWIEHWIRRTTTIGQGEFDSPTYIIVFLSPLLTLHEFAADERLRAKAGKMVDWILADYAVEYLRGLYAGGHSRDYTYDAIAPEGAPSVGWGWLFFGDTSPVYRSDNLLAAWGSYRLPVVIHNVAVDRTEPYTHHERKRVRNVIRYGDQMNPPVYKTTHMTAAYALGSLQGGIQQPIQQHTWDVTYVDDRPNTTVFTVHPYFSGYELAMFFPEEIEWLSDEVDRYHLVYTDPNKWNSSSPYERTFQHENALIILYDLAEDAMHPHVNGFFPKSLDERVEDESGWIFFRGGRMYGAMYPLRPYEWIEEEVNWRLRSHERRNGFVVEVAQAEEYDSFEAFQAQIRANALDTSRFESAASVSYVTSSGHRMAFTFPDERRLDGEPIDLSDIPLFRGPYVNGAAGRMVVTHRGMRHEVDVRE